MMHAAEGLLREDSWWATISHDVGNVDLSLLAEHEFVEVEEGDTVLGPSTTTMRRFLLLAKERGLALESHFKFLIAKNGIDDEDGSVNANAEEVSTVRKMQQEMGTIYGILAQIISEGFNYELPSGWRFCVREDMMVVSRPPEDEVETYSELVEDEVLGLDEFQKPPPPPSDKQLEECWGYVAVRRGLCEN